MSSKTIINQARLNEWASRFADQKASGLSVSQWCLQNNITKDKYFYWKRKLKDEIVTKALPDIVPISLPVPSEPEPITPSKSNRESCSSCTSCATIPTGSCSRVYINGITVEFDSSAPENLIKGILKAVRHV